MRAPRTNADLASSLTDGLALLRGLREAAHTPEGRRLLGELVFEVSRALDGDENSDPIAEEAARLLARSRQRDRVRHRRDHSGPPEGRQSERSERGGLAGRRGRRPRHDRQFGDRPC